MELRSVLSPLPGDPLARFALRCNILDDTASFYQDLLGLEQVALDETCLCVRYPAQEPGVPTTLVFETIDDTEKGLVFGNCFDHFVISTNDLALVEETIRSKCDDADKVIFMTLRSMFGSTLMGLRDPNGFKVCVMEQPHKPS